MFWMLWYMLQIVLIVKWFRSKDSTTLFDKENIFVYYDCVDPEYIQILREMYVSKCRKLLSVWKWFYFSRLDSFITILSCLLSEIIRSNTEKPDFMTTESNHCEHLYCDIQMWEIQAVLLIDLVNCDLCHQVVIIVPTIKNHVNIYTSWNWLKIITGSNLKIIYL